MQLNKENSILEKMKIIVIKLDKIFLLIPYTISKIEIRMRNIIKESIQDSSDILAFYLEEYLQMVDNKKKTDELLNDIEKSYIMINDMKEIIKK
jgi:hypothetical protein